MPNTFGIAKKGTLAVTEMPIEWGMISGKSIVIVIKKSYFISKVYGIEDLSIVGGIELA